MSPNLAGGTDNPADTLPVSLLQRTYERPSDWISRDPDFRALHLDSTIFEKFARFVAALDREDYSAAYLDGECPRAGAGPGPGPREDGRPRGGHLNERRHPAPRDGGAGRCQPHPFC